MVAFWFDTTTTGYYNKLVICATKASELKISVIFALFLNADLSVPRCDLPGVASLDIRIGLDVLQGLTKEVLQESAVAVLATCLIYPCER